MSNGHSRFSSTRLCSQNLDECSLARARKIFAIARMLGYFKSYSIVQNSVILLRLHLAHVPGVRIKISSIANSPNTTPEGIQHQANLSNRRGRGVK